MDPGKSQGVSRITAGSETQPSETPLIATDTTARMEEELRPGQDMDDIILYLNVSDCSESIPLEPYNRPLPASILSITHTNKDIKPFRQRIKLAGASKYPVRATALVDDGAMRNCISTRMWQAYGHCLGSLTPTTLRVSVANNQTVPIDGLWHGEVDIGGTTSEANFVVFNCNGAFDIILGKPWLTSVKASHDYATDTLIIPTGENTTTTVPNIESSPTPEPQIPPTTLPPNPNTSTPPATLDELIAAEVLRIEVLQQTHGPFAESRWAKYLDVEDLLDDELEQEPPDTGVQWFTTRAEQREIERRKQRERKHDKRRANQATIDWLTEEARMVSEIEHPGEPSRPKTTTEKRLELDEAYKLKWRTRRIWHTVIHSIRDTDADPLETAEATRLIDSEKRISQLHKKLTYLRELALDQDTESNKPQVFHTNTVTDREFKIDRGVNESKRFTDPFSEDRVNEILQKIQIGSDLTADQITRTKALIREFADVFALSLSEVQVVDWYKHHLNIDPSVKLPTRTGQRPVTEAQKDWFFSILDEMEDAHVIQKVPGEFIKSISSTNLAPKEAGKIGATRTEILRKVNAECIKNGLPPFWEEVREPGESDEAMLEAVESIDGTKVQTKWRVCHAFNALNKATRIPSFPQGDLKAKQEFAAGHRWASVIDFAAGYYAIPLDDESVPYVAFYVEGRGHYVYLRMPFGLTGAPATFCEMVAIALEDMIGRELVNWMDDICLPGDNFEVKLQNLRKLFTRCRDRGLSLSPSKTRLFQTDVLFAGAMVGPGGIKPNMDKVAAVTNWPTPLDVHDLMGFLGLTNYFRRSICNYARIAQPLTDLTRDVSIDIPKGAKAKTKKGAYKRALQSASLKGKWGADQDKAFLTLKVLLSTAPVLRPPQYDGRSFRVTSDGSGSGLAGFLSQPFTETDTNGKDAVKWLPVAYCSKRTSKSEERYEPYLLEFAALKYCFDEFEQYVYGAPVEIETDCQALRDCLLKEKMSIHHSRWKESILAHNIIDIRHRPGVENPVADGLSRMWQNRKRRAGDGSDWSVLPDWEATRGIKNDILTIADSPLPTTTPLPFELVDHFKDDAYFEPIVSHLLGRNTGATISERNRVMHRSKGFIIEDGKLWRLSTKANDRVSRTVCIPKHLTVDTALAVHREIGHFKSLDSLKIHIHERYFWPGMDNDCRQVVLECPECKHFGPAPHNHLLQPIRRSRPFSLITGDYLTLPKGYGGYIKVGLYIDVYSNFTWGVMLKAEGKAKDTVKTLERIFREYATPESFMADGGGHFTGDEVKVFCASQNVTHITTPPRSPWVNGLIENSNKLLLARLKGLCAPAMDDLVDSDTPLDANAMPYDWPKHFDEAIRQLNDRIRPSIRRTPRELLFGLAMTPEHKQQQSSLEPTTDNLQELVNPPIDLVDENLSLADMLRMNAHLLQLETAEQQKSNWDNRTPATDFNIGDIVQWYNNELEDSKLSVNKLLPRWSMPHIITGKFLNSYSISTLYGTELPGKYHSRRLRHYTPLRGSNLQIAHDNANILPASSHVQDTNYHEVDGEDGRMVETESSNS